MEKIPELGEFRFWGPKFYVWREHKDDDVKTVHLRFWLGRSAVPLGIPCPSRAICISQDPGLGVRVPKILTKSFPEILAKSRQ